MSARWQVMGKPLVLVDENNGKQFLKRWRILQTPLFSIFIHRMEVPDPGRDLHDHPWAFWSMVLKGGYTEWVADSRTSDYPWIRTNPRWSTHTVRLDECHTIDKLYGTTWTLVLTGPTRRRWGFYADQRWFDWEYDYDYSRRYPWKAAP